MAKKHFIKNKSGNAVAVIQRPQDVEDAAKAANSGKPPPKPKQLPPGEVVFGMNPPVSTTGQLLGWPYYLPPHQANSNWCIPDGAFLFFITVQKVGTPGVIYTYANPIGFPIQDMTVNGRIYSATPGSITEAFNKGTLELEWQTLSSHYGPNHVRPTAVFSNLQTGTFTNYAGNNVSPGVPPNFPTAGQPFVGDSIDFTITHTGMHDIGWPHIPPSQTSGSNYMDPTGNQHFLVSGLYSEFNTPVTCYAVEIHNITYDGQLWDPYNLPLPWLQAALANPDKEIFPVPMPPSVMGLRPILAGYDVFGVGVGVGVSACLDQTFQSWPYGYQETWIHDVGNPNMTLVSGNMVLTHPSPSGTLIPNTGPPCQVTAPYINAGTPLTIQELDAYANCGWQLHMQNNTAHIDYPNQFTFCEWRTSWINNGSPVGGFVSPEKPANAPGPAFNGLMAHEFWGYTTAFMEQMASGCGCCETVVNPGWAAYPFPPQNGAVLANWVM